MALNKNTDISIPEDVQEKWQEIVDILSQICKVPAALVMRLNGPHIEVFSSSQSEGNPYNPGDKEDFENSGLYCETVIKTKSRLQIPYAPADDDWKNNPDIKLNMVSYLGFPIFLPTGKPFGTICLLDNKKNEYSSLIEKLMLKFKEMIEYHLELLCANLMLGDKTNGCLTIWRISGIFAGLFLSAPTANP